MIRIYTERWRGPRRPAALTLIPRGPPACSAECGTESRPRCKRLADPGALLTVRHGDPRELVIRIPPERRSMRLSRSGGILVPAEVPARVPVPRSRSRPEFVIRKNSPHEALPPSQWRFPMTSSAATGLESQCDQLRSLHRPGAPLLLPNAWDAATARAVVAAGFPVVATTSAGVAATLGYADAEGAPADEMLAMAARIAR